MRKQLGLTMHLLLGLLVLAAFVIAPASNAWAQPATLCGPSQSPHFASGFASLSARLGPIMGTPITCEYPDPKGTGDVEQNTTRGLAFWRNSTNTPTFTDGSTHWALTNRGLVTWTGSSIDPPGAAMATAPGFTYPVVEAPFNPPGNLACQRANPSCGRDAWWGEWNELQESSLVQYRFLGPGLITERRFTEAIWLVWRWPEGGVLLQSAADQGLGVVTASAADLPTAFSAFSPGRHLIGVNDDFNQTSTWMVADLLAHELRHAADQAAGVRQANTFADCIQREQVAYQTEDRFVHWLANTLGGLPSDAQIAAYLSPADHVLYDNITSIYSAPDVNALALSDYLHHCS
jgi:hypothetical protein